MVFGDNFKFKHKKVKQCLITMFNKLMEQVWQQGDCEIPPPGNIYAALSHMFSYKKEYFKLVLYLTGKHCTLGKDT